MIARLVRSARRFLVREDGPTAVEYAVLLALVVAACLVAADQLGRNSSRAYDGANRGMDTEEVEQIDGSGNKVKKIQKRRR